jgi:hypothetical protein
VVGGGEPKGERNRHAAPLRVRPIGSGEFGRYIAGIVQGKTPEGRSHQVCARHRVLSRSTSTRKPFWLRLST